MELVDYINRQRNGLPTDTPPNDRPECTCPIIAVFVRRINDGLLSDEARGRVLGPVIEKLLDTRSTPEIEQRRAFLAADRAVRTFAPLVLPAKEAGKLQRLEPIVNKKSALDAVDVVASINGFFAHYVYRVAQSAAGYDLYNIVLNVSYVAIRTAAHFDYATVDPAIGALGMHTVAVEPLIRQLIIDMCDIK